MYYSSNAEEELGFDAFIAPDDFDRTAQPVDIYEVFKREYALSQRARYIYYYSDGNYPLTLTPTTNEYYRYGYTQDGVDVIVDVPLNGSAVTVFGETASTKRWLIIYRVTTTNFSITISVRNALWAYFSNKIYEIKMGASCRMKYIHLANINSITQIPNSAINETSIELEGSLNIPETVLMVGNRAFAFCDKITKVNFPNTKDVFINHAATFVSIPRRIIEINFGASTSITMDETAYSLYINLSRVSVSNQNNLYTSFEGCDVIFTKDKNEISLIAPKTVRGICLPDELPQSQIDLLGTKLQANIMANHQLYIGTQITDLTNLYLANKSFVTIEVGAVNTAFAVENGILYNLTKTQLIKAGTYNTGDLIIPNTVTEVLANSFLRCSGYTGNLTIPSSVTSIASGAFSGLTNMTSLTLPVGYDTAIYNDFGFANFSADSLNTAILNLANGTAGTPKYFYISKTSLDALNIAYPNAVSDAALRYINVVSIVMDGLKLWLDASNPLSYPGTGTLWSDLSGNGNNGTLVNGVAYSTANGGVMSFNGVNGYVATTNSVNYIDFIVAVKIYSIATGLRGILATGISTDKSFRMQDSVLRNPGDVNDFIRPATNIRINGVLKNNLALGWNIISARVTNKSSVPPSFIMHLASGFNGRFFVGEMGFIAAYDRALTPEEVNQNFQATRQKYNI